MTQLASPDFFLLPFYGKIPGSYFHILGAHTLKRGTPYDLMWFPALLVAGIAILYQALGHSRSARPAWAVMLGLPVIALVLDERTINIDIMSGLLAVGIATFGFQRIKRKYYSAEVDAMTTTALGLDKASSELDVYALKIANLA
jgi:hypothetical protein